MSLDDENLSNIPKGESLFNSRIKIVKFEEDPSTPSWSLEPIYRVGSRDQWLVWQVMFDSKRKILISSSGQIGGKIKETTKNVLVNKSGRDIQEQALLEARSKYKKKIDEGYLTVYKISKGQKPLKTVGTKQFKVMLAHQYNPERVDRWPVAGEVKLDGIRAYSYLDPSAPDGVAIKSRTHKDFPWLNHIRKQLLEFFKYLPEGSILDGELYTHELSFNQISSAVRKKTTISPLNTKLKYFIFDIVEPENLVFEDRYNLLSNTHRKFMEEGNPGSELVIVPMTLLFSDEEIKISENDWTRQGFEGVIIRQLAAPCIDNTLASILYIEPNTGLNIPIRFCTLDSDLITKESREKSIYKGGRNYNLMKYKTFIDEEGKVVDIIKEPRTGSIVLVIEDIRGNILHVNPSGKRMDHQEWLKNKKNYIGLDYTFKYKELSEYNVPREPVGKSFRTYE